MPQACLVRCFNCLSDFDALEAIWCSCNPQRPTKVCPFCLGCFCAAGDEFKEAFWRDAPEMLREETRTLAQSRMLIGEMLVRAGAITTTQLLNAINQQKTDGRRLGEILIDNGSLPPDRLERFLNSQQTVAAVDMSRARVDAQLLRRLGVDQCLQERILPLEAEAFRDKHIMTLAMADPSDTDALERVRVVTGYQVIPGVASGEAIESAIRAIFPRRFDPARPQSVHATGDDLSREREELVALLRAALKRRASHLHIQTQAGVASVSYRIDGHLYLDRARGEDEASAALAACRTIAGLSGPPSREPRAECVDIMIDGVAHQVVVRVRPGPEGEELSAKILDPVAFPPRLDAIGMPDSIVEKLRRALEARRGLILVSSPPYSGCSSTVYALVMEIASRGRPLLLLESPRLVSLMGATQAEFSTDPNPPLAELCAGAASRRAEVLAITSSSGIRFQGGLERLSESMLLICRVEAMTLGGALLKVAALSYPPAALSSRETIVLHQRLLRKICIDCRSQASTAGTHAQALGLDPAEAENIMVWQGEGCERCAPTPGYRGRVPLVQHLRVTPALARAVAAGSAGAVKRACAAAVGTGSLMRQALEAMAAGLTTPSEITRRSLD